jgi:hypothetical protein
MVWTPPAGVVCQSEYRGCPPQVVRGSAAQAVIAPSVNQTAKLPR